MFDKGIWNEFEVEALRKMCEAPFKMFIDEVYESVMTKSKDLGLDRISKVVQWHKNEN